MGEPLPECDITKTQIVVELLKMPADQRDTKWTDEFLSAVQTASFRCAEPQIVKGPDGFPYFGLHTPEPGVPFTSFCISNLAPNYLFENGYGVVINPGENKADYVFSHGDIVNLNLNKVFYSAPVGVTIDPQATLQKDETVLIAQPSESYLPTTTRNVLKKYLQFFGLKEPKIMLLSRTIQGEMVQELAINIFKEEVGHPENLGSFMQQVGWFLPRHYILVILPKDSEWVNHFENL